MSEEVEVMGEWSVEQAWKACRGDAPFPAKIRESGTVTDVDRVVASFFGDVNEERLQRAHAAVESVYPRLVDSTLPKTGLHGEELKKHIIKTTVKAMKEYRKEVGVTLKELREDIESIQDWNFEQVSDWFYVWDALGSTGVSTQDSDMADFYRFAGLNWHYSKLG